MYPLQLDEELLFLFFVANVEKFERYCTKWSSSFEHSYLGLSRAFLLHYRDCSVDFFREPCFPNPLTH